MSHSHACPQAVRRSPWYGPSKPGTHDPRGERGRAAVPARSCDTTMSTVNFFVPCHARRGTNLTARPVSHQCRYHALQKTPPDPSCSRYFTDVLGGTALPPDPDTTLQVGTCVKHRVRIQHSPTCAWPSREGSMLNTLSVLCDRVCSVMGVDTDGDGCL